MNHFKFCLIALVMITGMAACTKDKDPVEEFPITTSLVWNKMNHCAFTDLVRFNNAFYITFREAASHTATAATAGRVRILKTTDGSQWEEVALIALSQKDIRDPKLSITPDNRIMVIMDVEEFNVAGNTVISRKPHVSFSDANGAAFSVPEACTLDPSVQSTTNWIWRVTWHKGVGYGIDYSSGKGYFLVKTTDGKTWEKITNLEVDGTPNEATIRFNSQDNMYILIRRESEDQLAVLAEANAPYTNFKFTKMPFRVGGPDFLFLDDNTLVVGTRWYNEAGEGSGTVLYVVDLAGNIKRSLKVPSAGDSSYTGMVLFENKLWFSYYTSHWGPTHVWWASVPVDELYKTE
jgi:hypothetical protein